MLYVKFLRLIFPNKRSAKETLNAIKNHPANIKIVEKDKLQIYTLFDYKEDSVRKAIHFLKYKGLDEFADFFAGHLKDFLQDLVADELLWEDRKMVLLPIPLHKLKKRKRSYNQMELVLKKIRNDFVCDFKSLKRIKNTGAQHKLNKTQRKTNLKDAFDFEDGDYNDDAHFIIIDDIVTSGATLQEARKAVRKKLGKSRITLVSLTRA